MKEKQKVVKFRKTRSHQRYTTPDGLTVDGVTTIINKNLGWNKDVLVGWARREGQAGRDSEAVKREQADIGSLAHFLCECFLKGWTPDLEEFSPSDRKKAEDCFEGFSTWLKPLNYETIDTEKQIVSPWYRYGGTRDWKVRLDNVLTIVDFKTGTGVYADHIIQGAALCALDFYDCFPEEFHKYSSLENIDPKASMKEVYDELMAPYMCPYIALHLGKTDGSFAQHVYTPTQLYHYWVTFLHLLEVNRCKKLIN